LQITPMLFLLASSNKIFLHSYFLAVLVFALHSPRCELIAFGYNLNNVLVGGCNRSILEVSSFIMILILYYWVGYTNDLMFAW
jgi:hypothetical protein